ncbi:hypothetical protein LSUE1_G006881, partial [Lachnellula suecica]
MAAVAAGSVDIDKPGKYPIVLSDALLGKASKEVYTGIRYNHKPDPSSDSTSSMHLEASDSSGYDLSLTDNSDRYSYHGARTTGDGQFVLIFDAVKKHFVLHRIDSTFDMNLVSAPWAQDASTLRSQYPQLETPQSKNPAASQPPQRKPAKTTKKAATAAKTETQRKKVEKAKKPKPPVREPSPEEEEESDDGLTIEYPDGPSSQTYQYQSTPVFRRDPSEDGSEEDIDAEGEEERNQDVDHLKLPSPANNNAGGMSDEEMEMEMEMEMDLEAELEQALKEQGGGGDEDSE